MAIMLTIDPGASLAASVWDLDDSTIVWYGKLKTKSGEAQETRLAAMGAMITQLFDDYEPSVLVMENVLPLARACKSKDAVLWLVGTYVIGLTTAVMRGVDFVLPLPTQLKKSVTGNGTAKKTLMVHTINEQLGLQLKMSQHNEADALGLGVYYLKNNFKKEVA